jgi:hypothetical protein
MTIDSISHRFAAALQPKLNYSAHYSSRADTSSASAARRDDILDRISLARIKASARQVYLLSIKLVRNSRQTSSPSADVPLMMRTRRDTRRDLIQLASRAMR